MKRILCVLFVCLLTAACNSSSPQAEQSRMVKEIQKEQERESKEFAKFVERNPDVLPKSDPDNNNIMMSGAEQVESLNRVVAGINRERTKQAISIPDTNNSKDRESAKKDNFDTQCDEANRYLNGTGVKADEKIAFEIYANAARQGSARAQNQLGILYEEGIGVDKSCSESIKWYTKAANQNYAKAKANLALRYHEGTCVDKNLDKSLQLYVDCAEAGITQCMKSASIVFYKDFHNSKSAFKWISKAAKKGDAEAQRLTGYMYYNGYGVGEDKRMASYWYRKASAQGDKIALEAVRSSGL